MNVDEYPDIPICNSAYYIRLSKGLTEGTMPESAYQMAGQKLAEFLYTSVPAPFLDSLRSSLEAIAGPHASTHRDHMVIALSDITKLLKSIPEENRDRMVIALSDLSVKNKWIISKSEIHHLYTTINSQSK
jgi:hypothetical protein